MKMYCRNCHFLAKVDRDESGAVYKNSLSPQERAKADTDSENIVPHFYTLNCYMGVWDEGIIGNSNRNEIINENVRKRCFFYPYTPGMMFDAAKELQKREQEFRAIRTSNFYTRIGLWIAAGALLLNSLIFYFKN